MDSRHETDHRIFNGPEETREFLHGHVKILSLGGMPLGLPNGHDAWVGGR